MFAEKFTHLADVIANKSNGQVKDTEIIAYGLSLIVKYILNFATTLILGLLFNMVFECFVFLISFMFLRTFSGGYHCKKASNCYVMSTGVVALVLVMAKSTPESYILILSVIILILSVPILLKFAPVETPTKPLDDAEKKYFRKKTILHLAIECCLIAILFIVGYNIYAFTVCLAIFVSAGLVILEILVDKKRKSVL